MAEIDYGPVIRTISAGEAFGELALLQPQALRTATVIAAKSSMDSSLTPETDVDTTRRETQSSTASGSQQLSSTEKVSLIKITRQLFDESVTSLQVMQLEERLSFLMRFHVRPFIAK
jgi:hypothetical protein